jgi:hypothetical protein
MPAIAWVQAEPWEFRADLGLHVELYPLLLDALFAVLLYEVMRRLAPTDERYLVRATAIGVGGGIGIEAVGPTVLKFQGHFAWLSLIVWAVLVPLALSMCSRGASRPRRTPLIMSMIAAWIAFPIVRFSDLVLTHLAHKIKPDRWSTLENLVVFVLLGLFWFLATSLFTWWYGRRKGAVREGKAQGSDAPPIPSGTGDPSRAQV